MEVSDESVISAAAGVEEELMPRRLPFRCSRQFHPTASPQMIRSWATSCLSYKHTPYPLPPLKSQISPTCYKEENTSRDHFIVALQMQN